MQTKTYGMKEGFLIGGGLICIGLILQLCIGPVIWNAFRWPINGVLWAFFLALIAALYLLRKKTQGLLFIGSYKAAIPALVYVVALTIVMGLTRQDEQDNWLHHMLSFWPFVLIYIYTAVILGLVVLRQLSTWATTRFAIRHFPISILSHLGLFLAMTTATLSTADIQRVKMIAVKDSPEWRATSMDQHIVEMPFTIKLKQFHMETYESGKPKRFASDIQVVTQSGQHIDATIDVNKPIEVDGWKIYQYGYDTQMGAMSQASILELISDPWLPMVYAGIYMLLAGAICFMLLSIPWAGGWRQAQKHPKGALAITLLIGGAFFCVHHFMPILHSDTLVPALQSPWFRPHIIAYMLAYTLMASATIMAIYKLFTHSTTLTSIDIIVYVGLSLITIGMLFGALWAKEAWGHYWSWDPKETWAAITWFAYLVFIHYRQIPSHKPKMALWILIISFVLLQMCWWGIKFLPSAQETSAHVYSA